MTSTQEDSAALLVAGRDPANAAVVLPAASCPATLEAAYRLQTRVVARLQAAGRGRPIGFKIGASSERAQRYLGLTEPFSGQVLAGGLHSSPARLPAQRFRFRLVEPEFAFVLARDLPPRNRRYSESEVAEAVGTLHPAIEIVASAYGKDAWHRMSARELVADNGVHGCLVLGEGRRDWRRFDLAAHRVELWIDGSPAGSGSGAAALGHPLTALTWLANQQSRAGRGLRAGEAVTTGVVTPFVFVEAGQRAAAEFGALGSCRVAFA